VKIDAVMTWAGAGGARKGADKTKRPARSLAVEGCSVREA
jgi:hypothetical protein